ncbi:MAG: aspartate-semialdehyde dehydrogenase [Limnohabitans sp.]|nr:aspartate-semialdehyde dehydrogenase [Limnohabitans sp.]
MMRLPNHPSVAIVGATGAVGREMLAILESRAFPLRSLRLFASPRSAGSTIRFRGDAVACEVLSDRAVEQVDLVLFSAGKETSKEWAPRFRDAGAIVIDNSSAFRADPACPLVVPEVNPHALDAVDQPTIIANPNCSTIIALVAVTPLHRAIGVERMIAATYQAASGAGASAMAELESQARSWTRDEPLDTRIFGRQYLFNVFSHNSAIGADGYNEEERKLLTETRRMWESNSVRVSATCVRVPTLRAHAEALHLEFARATSEHEIRAFLATAPGVRVVDDRASNKFPEPLDAAGQDDVLVGRIRMDPSVPDQRGAALFVCGDQIRKGAALNAVQLAEWFLPQPRTRTTTKSSEHQLTQ